MKVFFLKLLCCTFVFSLRGICSLENMQKDFLKNCAMQEEEGQKICKAFVLFDELCRSSATYSEIVNTSSIQEIFLAEESPRQRIVAQLLFVVLLHEKFLAEAIVQINLQLQDISRAKQYWIQYMLLQPSLCKFFRFSKCKKDYKDFFNEKITMLESLENVQAELLGICLLSQHRLQKVSNVYQFKDVLDSVFDPFRGFGIDKQSLDLFGFFKSISSIDFFLQEKQKFVAHCLHVYGIPGYNDRYFYMYTGTLLSCCMGIFVWQKDNNVAYQEKAQRAFHGFLQDFLLGPLKGLKRAVWDRPDIKLKRFDLEQIPDTVWSCYTPERMLKYPLQTVLYNMNKGIDVAEEIIKGQQINYYLSAIVPIVLGLYMIYRNGNYYYNHESYFKPMRMILREIDVLCNVLQAKQEMSCIDYGKIYGLVFQLKKYLSCLSSQEKIMIIHDLGELLSFDFTIQQKHKVVERMYRTYSFLK